MTRPNLLTVLIDYYDARFPGRINYAKGTALATLAAVSANALKTHVSTPLQTRGNVFVLICGPSTTGKTSVVNFGDDLLENIGFKNILTDDITPETFPKFLNQHKFGLMKINEMSKMLGSYKKKSYMAGLREMLIQAWDGAVLTQARAGREATEAKNYSFSAIADSQPVAVAESADEVDIQSGFLPRFIWFIEPNPSPVAPRLMDAFEIKNRLELIDTLKTLFKVAVRVNIYFKFTQDQVTQIYNRMRAKAPGELYMFQPFYDRGAVYVYKLAMLHMFGSYNFLDKLVPPKQLDESPHDSVDWTEELIKEEDTTDMLQGSHHHDRTVDMDDDSVAWAIEFMQDYIDKSIPQVLRILKLNDAEKVKEAVERYLEEHNGKRIPESILYRLLVHGMRDYNRMRLAVGLAEKMHYVKRFPTRGGTNYGFHEEPTQGIEQYVHNSAGEEDSVDIDEED